MVLFAVMVVFALLVNALIRNVLALAAVGCLMNLFPMVLFVVMLVLAQRVFALINLASVNAVLCLVGVMSLLKMVLLAVKVIVLRVFAWLLLNIFLWLKLQLKKKRNLL